MLYKLYIQYYTEAGTDEWDEAPMLFKSVESAKQYVVSEGSAVHDFKIVEKDDV